MKGKYLLLLVSFVLLSIPLQAASQMDNTATILDDDETTGGGTADNVRRALGRNWPVLLLPLRCGWDDPCRGDWFSGSPFFHGRRNSEMR